MNIFDVGAECAIRVVRRGPTLENRYLMKGVVMSKN